MLTKSVLTVLVLVLLLTGLVSGDELEGPYLGQRPPGDKPELFAPGIVSSGFHDMDITISPDLNEIFFTRSSPFDWHSSTIYLKNDNGNWSKPELAPFIISVTDSVSYSFISPDGKKIYFNSRRSTSGTGKMFGGTIWFSERNKDGKWNAAKPLNIMNKGIKERFPSVSNNGNIYFYARTKSGTDIFYCQYNNNKYGIAKSLGANINTKHSEFHPYIAPDESYLIFDRYIPESGQDLFISFKKNDGSWTEAVNMGTTINVKDEADIRPYVSPDGKYLFFASTRSQKNKNYDLTYSGFMNRISSFGNHSQDIYWVDARIIQKLKKKVLKSK